MALHGTQGSHTALRVHVTHPLPADFVAIVPGPEDCMLVCRHMWGALCAAPAPCEKQAILDLFSPMAKATAVPTVFPYTGLLRFLLSPKNQIMS